MYIYAIRTTDGFLVDSVPVYVPEQVDCKKQAEKALRELAQELKTGLVLHLEQVKFADDPRG